MSPAETATRPRVEGDREQEIYDATLEVLEEVGYDRLTMDAVATRAKAGKATLYRRWTASPSSWWPRSCRSRAPPPRSTRAPCAAT
jgi:maltoporin